jgi:hypothetical protein
MGMPFTLRLASSFTLLALAMLGALLCITAVAATVIHTLIGAHTVAICTAAAPPLLCLQLLSCPSTSAQQAQRPLALPT